MNSHIIGWKDLFRGRILERGLNYYQDGFVTSVSQEGGVFQAQVSGTEDYHVEIEVKGNRIYDMQCDCPYAIDGNYCKHEAAVLYKACGGDLEEDDSPKMNWMESIHTRNLELNEAVKKIPTKALQDIVMRLAREDESLRNEIILEYSESFDARQMKLLKAEIDGYRYQYGGYKGFIDYNNAYDFAFALTRFMDEKVSVLIEKNLYMQAFELVNYVFRVIGNCDMDDSDGGSMHVSEKCYNFWLRIVNECDEADFQKIKKWFIKHQHGFVIDYMEDYIHEFLNNELNDVDGLQALLEEVDASIANRTHGTDVGTSYSIHYGHEDLLLKRIRLMKKMGKSEEEINDYKVTKRRFSTIRETEISELLSMGKKREAIEVLKESKLLDVARNDLVKKYSEQLIGIYKDLESKGELKEELLFQVFNCIQKDLRNINELRSMSSTSEWEKYRDDILEGHSAPYIRLQLLENEGMHKQLMIEVCQSDCIYILEKYEKLLKRKYPNELRKAYERYLLREAELASKRDHYSSLMKYLKKIRTFPEGKSHAQEIANKWKIQYKRRPAMQDELRRAGF